MYWIPSILNQANLFKRYVDYMNKDTTSRKVIDKLAQLLFRANIICLDIQAIFESEKLALTLVESYKNQLLLPSGKCAISAPPIFMMSSRVGSALASLRIMQDMMRYVASDLFGNGVSMPKSLSDACKKGLSKYLNNGEVISLIQSYWDSSGANLRAMRVVDQHYENLMGKALYDVSGDKPRIIMLLPDNPEDQSPKKFRYEKDIHATEFLKRSFDDLHAVYDRLAELAGYAPKAHEASAHLEYAGALKENEERTLGLLIDIERIRKNNEKTEIVLDTIEIRQVIPKGGKGNISVRKMRTDAEVAKQGGS